MSETLLNPYFGEFGGMYVPEILVPVLQQLEKAFVEAKDDPEFQREFQDLLKNYAGRPTALTLCRNLTKGTKAFIKQFSLNLRADLAGTQIRVTNVEPGLCGGTEFSNVRFKGDDARAQKLYENVEYVSPQDIANIVLWLNQQPEHVNINRIEVMPTAQTFAPLNVARIQK